MKRIPNIYQDAALLQKTSTSLPCTVDSAVLVVDNGEAVCRILERMLSDEHYQVKLGHSGAAALEVTEQNVFDVIPKPFSRAMISNALKKAIEFRRKWPPDGDLRALPAADRSYSPGCR